MYKEQHIVMDVEHSEWTQVKSSVPQGSVIAFLILYINHLSNNSTSNVTMFAYDCVNHSTISKNSDAHKQQNDVHMWCNCKKMINEI